MMNAIERHRFYTNDDVRTQLKEFRENNYYPNYRLLAKEIGITYSYLIEFKNGTREMGQEALKRVVNFIEEEDR